MTKFHVTLIIQLLSDLHCSVFRDHERKTVCEITGLLGKVVANMSDAVLKKSDGGRYTHQFKPSHLN